MEPYWNQSRIEQIEGRGFRSCSHRYLPAKDRTIKTFMYLSVFNKRDNKKKQQEIIKKYKNLEKSKKDKGKPEGRNKKKDLMIENTKMLDYVKYFVSVEPTLLKSTITLLSNSSLSLRSSSQKIKLFRPFVNERTRVNNAPE